ncbi:MAG: nucleotidyltransferase family protein [Methanoregula sp.]|jgi:NDP-sugar pyrophosphorylase family protein|uniref:nucleotidyltransferase family protein n=1 Tax=Methanoregula sp. TaxID=2052170 RepID=UPI003C18EB7B
MLPVVILAGGLATRLYPVTQKIPKSLIVIDGRPFIDHQLELLKEKGVTRIVLCVGNFGEMIEAHVGDGSRSGLEVQYSYDGDILLGTGGAIKKAARLLPDAFMILYGDSYLNIDIAQVVQRFYESNFPVLMTVYRNRNTLDTSNIIMKEGKIVRYDKKSRDPAMEYIDYGLIAIRKKVFDEYPANEPFDLSLVLSRLVDAGQVVGYEVTKRFYEIGSTSGIKETEEYIRTRKPDQYHE